METYFFPFFPSNGKISKKTFSRTCSYGPCYKDHEMFKVFYLWNRLFNSGM